jgi:hypothetical protein
MEPQATPFPERALARSARPESSRSRGAATIRWPSPHALRSRKVRTKARARALTSTKRLSMATIASRGFTGQGPIGVHRRRLSLCERFTPTRSARTPPVARSLRHRMETPMLPAPCHWRPVYGRLSRSRRTPLTPAKGRARVPPMTCSREVAGPESREDHSSADDANATRGQGPHHPFFREEERDQPHPRCLPLMSRLATGRSAEASPPVARRSPARASPTGVLSYPQAVTNLWTTPAPLAIPSDPLPLTRQRGRGTGDVYR